jgi:hypothetical protein
MNTDPQWLQTRFLHRKQHNKPHGKNQIAQQIPANVNVSTMLPTRHFGQLPVALITMVVGCPAPGCWF